MIAQKKYLGLLLLVVPHLFPVSSDVTQSVTWSSGVCGWKIESNNLANFNNLQGAFFSFFCFFRIFYPLPLPLDHGVCVVPSHGGRPGLPSPLHINPSAAQHHGEPQDACRPPAGGSAPPAPLRLQLATTPLRQPALGVSETLPQSLTRLLKGGKPADLGIRARGVFPRTSPAYRRPYS